MNPPARSLNRMSETRWRAIIVTLSLAVLLFSVWCLMHGITIIFMHLYYFPIVLLAYRYRWKGCGLATLLALAYLGLVIAFDYGQNEVILGALYRFFVFVGIAVVIAYLADSLATARRTLQQSAELTDRYLSLAPAIVLALDRNGAITYLNKKGGEILECNPVEVTGKLWTDQFLPENERERVKQVISQLMDGQVEPNRVVENPVLTSGGLEKSIRWSNTLLHDEDGAITGILSFGEDITEEKWQQDTLREMQQFQESVITNANVWISVLEPDGTLLVWNDAAEAISGYKKTGVLGKKTVWKQLYPDREYRKKVTGEIQRIIGRDTFLENFETEIRCADGTAKTIVWNTRGLRDSKGTITSYIAIGRDVTAQKSAELRAGESSRFLAAMIETLPIPVFFKDAEGRYLGCNPPFEQYIGITCDNLIGKTAYDIAPKDLADRYTSADREILDNPIPQKYETQMQYADGSRHDVIFYKAPFLNRDGSVGGLIGAFLDITERKQMESQLALQNAQMSLAQQMARIGYWSFDIATGKPLWSLVMFLVFGLDPKKGVPHFKQHRDFIHPDDWEMFDAAVQGAVSGTPYDIVIRVIFADGSLHYVQTQGHPRRDAGGRISELFGISQDITGHKQAEAALLESESFNRGLVENLPDYIAVYGQDGKLLYVNPSSARALGYDADTLVGTHVLTYIAEEYRDTVKATMAVRRKEGDAAPYEIEMVTRDGLRRSVIVKATPIQYRNNPAMLLLLIDITERKVAEIQLQESEEKYRAFFSTSQDCVFITSLDGSWVDFNEAAVKLFGYDSREDLLKIKIPQIYANSTDRDAHIRHIRKEGYSFEYPVDLRRKDGTILHTLITTAARKDSSGNFLGFQGSIRDITERKRTEELLRQNQLQLATAMDIARIVNWEYDVATAEFTFDDRFYEFYGTTAEREGGYRMSAETYAREFVYPEDIPAVADEIQKVLRTKDPLFQGQMEHRIIRSDGEVRTIIVRHAPVMDEQGNVVRTFGANQDITERKRAEEAMRESKILVDAVVENVPLMIFLKEATDLRFVLFNRAGEELLGYDRQALLGKNNLDLFPPEQAAQFMEKDREVLDGEAGMLDIPEEPIQTAGKGLRLLHTRKVCIRGADGTTKFLLGISEDITERKRAEDELRFSNVILTTQQETSPDGILIVDKSGKIISFNHRFTEIWGIPQEVIDSRSDEQALSCVLEKLSDPQEFLSRVKYLYEHQQEKSQDEILFRDGKVFDRYSAPMLGEDNRYFGRVWYFHDITGRKRVEEAIRSREEQFRAIFHNQQTGLIMVDATTHTIADANNAALSMIGASHDEVVGKVCHTFICPAEVGKCPVTDLGHIVDNAERVLIRANGERIPILKSVNPIKIGGRPFLIESFIDLSERKRMENQINESRQLFADIISFLPDPTFVIDNEGKVLAWNHALEQISGVPATDIIGKADHEYSLWLYGRRRPIIIDLVLHPDLDAARLDYTAIRWEGNTITAQTDIILPGSGRRTSFSLVASPLMDARGTITGAIESIRDISSLREAEAGLARLNANLESIVHNRTRALEEEVTQRMHAEKDVQDALSYTRSVIEANPDLIVVLDRNGTVLDINASAEVLTGLTREQLIGTRYFGYLVDDGTLHDAFSRLLESGRLENIIQIRHTDGHVTPLSVNATLIGGRDAPDIRIIVSAHDITRQKHDEEVIRASLEEKVILLREVHHRVKNNLQIIISLVNLQMRQTDDPVVKQIMSETQNRVRAMSLVHEKLYRSESLSRIDFADYTRFLATQLFSFYGTDPRRVHLDFAMGKIMVDINTAVPLGLLMNELVSNALKHAFLNGREGTIRISGGYEGDLITLVVQDNGTGIPPDFDWKNTTSLGMRLVTSLIDQVDGTIDLDRTNGTAFTVTVKKDPGTGGVE